ncbi:cilia- and flagella-associated protein 68 [Misgurnus anguillicaudatus]|uniref:cilia- and flagella-associated protein 68 n=1 Tax=Misgurnus anguillicaudatus TaxID=75329 RepID=UPI003CCF7EB4
MATNKEFSQIQTSPPFHHMLRASGQGEIWYDFTDEEKFRRYGWRCSTNEDLYSNATLIGNWCEERLDTRRTVALRRPLPHQFSHHFETTYHSSYNKDERRPIYTTPKKESRSFPSHQPELDPQHIKCLPNSCYRLDFKQPEHRKDQVQGKSVGMFSR